MTLGLTCLLANPELLNIVRQLDITFVLLGETQHHQSIVPHLHLHAELKQPLCLSTPGLGPNYLQAEEQPVRAGGALERCVCVGGIIRCNMPGASRALANTGRLL